MPQRAFTLLLIGHLEVLTLEPIGAFAERDRSSPRWFLGAQPAMGCALTLTEIRQLWQQIWNFRFEGDAKPWLHLLCTLGNAPGILASRTDYRICLGEEG
jgi:hypothetical protein